MLTGFAIALALIVATGVIFIVLRGWGSPDPLAHKRKHKNHQRRREQAREEGPSGEDSGSVDVGEDKRPGKDVISKWSGLE
jgi:hypothetical protein